MIRFCGEDRIVRRDLDAALSREPLRLDKKIWERGRERFRTAPMGDGGAFYIPVVNGQGETVCFAYQDNEANRELRMLKELSKAEGTLQFTDLFPTCGEVVLHGCNELAVSFAEYLKSWGFLSGRMENTGAPSGTGACGRWKRPSEAGGWSYMRRVSPALRTALKTP